MAPQTGRPSLACARASKRLLAPAVALGLWLGAVLPLCAAGAERPERVVSINLCTDQLAMLLADPGQVISVSMLARDPLSSAMAEAAQAVPVNHAQAEEIFLMHPDLVLAGTFSPPGTVRMLRALGVEVVQLPIVTSLDEVPDVLRHVGALLGQQMRAEAMAAGYTARLAVLRAQTPPGASRPGAALYTANGYTNGAGTLADSILEAAGFENIAASAGVHGGGTLALERLVMIGPDLLITGARYPGASRAEALMDHPALMQLVGGETQVISSDGRWICGTPVLLDVVAELAARRAKMEAGQ